MSLIAVRKEGTFEGCSTAIPYLRCVLFYEYPSGDTGYPHLGGILVVIAGNLKHLRLGSSYHMLRSRTMQLIFNPVDLDMAIPSSCAPLRSSRVRVSCRFFVQKYNLRHAALSPHIERLRQVVPVGSL